MKYLFVFLATILLHVSTTLLAQTTPILPSNKPFVISAKIGSHTGTFKRFGRYDLPGSYDTYAARTLGIELNFSPHKRITLYGNFHNEAGQITKTINGPNGFFTSLLVDAIFNTDLSYQRPPMYTYSAKTTLSHFQFGGQVNMIARKQFRMYTGLGLSFSGGSSSYTDENGQNVKKSLSTEPRLGFTPLGISFGDKVRFNVAVGAGDTPGFSCGIGMKL